jgi:hypothetical protein
MNWIDALKGGGLAVVVLLTMLAIPYVIDLYLEWRRVRDWGKALRADEAERKP